MKNDFLWWRDGVIYQIYPRSFKDTTGSGIGDLNGIIQNLDYLADLCVDAVWLSPVNPSPDIDFGYDISDYREIDPKLGTMADFKRLVKEAEARGIRIVLDLVLNHSSDQHEWFRQSRSSRDNPYRDWYLWRDPEKGGAPPNNWQSVFGGKAWEWNAETGQYYLHMFSREQPDFNWWNLKVRAALLDIFRYWLDLGVKGFRLDVFNMYVKDMKLRDNPTTVPGLRPFDRQVHKYDCNRPELTGVLEDIRTILEKYPDSYAVGETFLSTPEKAASYCGDKLLQQTFNFKFLACPWNPERFSSAVEGWEDALGNKEWPNYVLNNHDVKRSATRYGIGENDERLKVAAAMLLTLRGTPFLYYGEEIGMREVGLKRSQILDPVGKRYWPFYRGRDGCRTPMQWDASAFAGFSSSQPWLPVHKNYATRNVQAHSDDPGSLLSFYRQLLALRREIPALARGSFEFLPDLPGGVLGYRREAGSSQAVVLLNFRKTDARCKISKDKQLFLKILSSKDGLHLNQDISSVFLKGDEALVLSSAG